MNLRTRFQREKNEQKKWQLFCEGPESQLPNSNWPNSLGLSGCCFYAKRFAFCFIDCDMIPDREMFTDIGFRQQNSSVLVSYQLCKQLVFDQIDAIRL